MTTTTSRTAKRERPRRLSSEVEAQLRKLEQLNDRYSVVLLWRAIDESERGRTFALGCAAGRADRVRHRGRYPRHRRPQGLGGHTADAQ